MMENLSRLPFGTWSPDTCNCIVNLKTKLLYKRCRSHNTFAEVQAHNKRFDTITKPTDTQRDTQLRNRETEKAKPEFQRR